MTDQEYAEFMREIAARAKEISSDTFTSYWTWSSIMDPYCTGYEGEDNVGRVWWVGDPDGPAVTAWDVRKAHPEIDWADIESREEKWSRDLGEEWSRVLSAPSEGRDIA